MGEDVFKVGQRVEIIKPEISQVFSGITYYQIGATGVVASIDSQGDAKVDFSESDESLYLSKYESKEWYVYKPSDGYAKVIGELS